MQMRIRKMEINRKNSKINYKKKKIWTLDLMIAILSKINLENHSYNAHNLRVQKELLMISWNLFHRGERVLIWKRRKNWICRLIFRLNHVIKLLMTLLLLWKTQILALNFTMRIQSNKELN